VTQVERQPINRRWQLSHPEEAPLAARVYSMLIDGQFRSGEDLATTLGVSRSAIWKAAVTLRALGVVIHAVRNRGYRLAAPSEVLDPLRIQSALSREARARLRQIDAVWALPSTNTALLARADLPLHKSDVCLAEYQTAGRGRRGRAWIAPPGASLCMSLSWNFPEVPRDLGALSLVTGVCALRALGEHGLHELRLKWPNDLLFEDRKLGGILIEMRAESAGPTYVVIGIGLNVMLGSSLLKQIAAAGTHATDLKTAGLESPSRNAIVSSLIDALLAGLEDFQQHGLRPFIEEWRRADALRGRMVNVLNAEETVRGVARGVDIGGALLVETPQGLRKFVSGEVSVRPDA
jgi:BirA family transcriptional regulator, biotin operon repressor / biotin---[acetyl-CoA-carboxylase] ligase